MAPAKKAAVKKVAKKKPAAKKSASAKVASAALRPTTKSAREKAREKLFTQINDGFGNAKPVAKGRILKGSQANPYRVIPTGSIKLDYDLGTGGWTHGRLSELWGIPGIGKSTLAYIGLANAQKAFPGEMVAFVDIESAYDQKLAAALGVDIDMLDLFEPENAEEVADVLKLMIRSGIYSMIVLDSIGAMISMKEKEKAADESVVAGNAGIVTRMTHVASSEVRKYDVALLVINQVRANIGGYGATTKTTGGFALDHGVSVKVQAKAGGQNWKRKLTVGGEEHLAGQLIALAISKNNMAPSGKTSRVELFIQPTVKYGPRGLRPATEALEVGLTQSVGAVLKVGSKYTLPDGQVVTGEAAAIAALEEDPELIAQIREIALRSVADEIVVDGEVAVDAIEPEEEVETMIDEQEPESVALKSTEGGPIFSKLNDEIDPDEFADDQSAS